MADAYSHHHQLTIPPEADGRRLDQALAGLLEQYSRSSIKQWIDAGHATLNGASAKPRSTVHAGDQVSLHARLAGSVELAAQDVKFEIVHRDPALLVVNKPAGVVVHPGAGNPDHTLVNGLLQACPELAALPRAGLVHRIDKDTSGLLLVARTSQSYQQLVRALAERNISRHYEAVVNGVLIAGGTIDQAIGRDPRQRTRMQVSPGGRNAVTHYRVGQRFRAHTLLKVELETGRTHQIRVHMAWHGHPLVGDHRYGGRPHPPRGADDHLRELLQHFPRQALHAASLSFCHPMNNEPMRFSAPLPDDLVELIAALATDAANAATE